MSGSLRYHIDAIGLGQTRAVTGWAFHDECAIRSLSVRLAHGGLVPCRHGLARTDVAASFPDKPTAIHSGFVARGLAGAGIVSLVAELDDGRQETVTLGQIGLTGFKAGTRHFSGTTIPLAPRPGFDFSYLGAILHACAEAPRNLPRLHAPPLLIAPVYGGLAHLRPFFDSLMRHTTAPYRLAIVDDGNSDPAILAIIAESGGRDGVTILRRPVNGGFVEAVATGFSLWRGEHVVLLNTDIILPAGWLERLVAPLEADPRIASTTPFASAGSLCGFPAMPDDNPLYLGLDTDRIDTALRCLDGPALLLPLPTGVGFCMGMGAQALGAIGFFERGTFGAGYGEENDWCRKAIGAGFRNVLTPNLFVHHAHGGSFTSEQKRRQMARNLAILHSRYPDYGPDIAELLLADPLAELRSFMAFKLAADTHPKGALLAVRGRRIAASPELRAAQASGRPVVVAEFDATSPVWSYSLSWPQGTLRLAGGNLAELPALARRVRIGGIVRMDLPGGFFARSLPTVLDSLGPFVQ